MRILLLSWEYPPKRLGNVADHVSTLAHELLRRGNEVELVALDDLKPGFEDVSGVHVHRVANPVKTHPMASILSYDVTASLQMETESSNIIHFYKQLGKRIDIVHAHEWLTTYPAIVLKHAFHIPFVMTFHSIEGHRCHDNFNATSLAIKEIEDMGMWESKTVITNTESLKREILRYYGEGHNGKMRVIWPVGPNWVDEVISVYNRAIT
ncbi:MAG: glycosyltransferase family 4 protein [Candidatus Bathyarchaeia archaeon]|jgi:glycosyltransferase involved in cell wall biosynthesis